MSFDIPDHKFYPVVSPELFARAIALIPELVLKGGSRVRFRTRMDDIVGLDELDDHPSRSRGRRCPSFEDLVGDKIKVRWIAEGDRVDVHHRMDVDPEVTEKLANCRAEKLERPDCRDNYGGFWGGYGSSFPAPTKPIEPPIKLTRRQLKRLKGVSTCLTSSNR